ncbi:MAG: Zn finger domain-containing DnaJ-class molecular chaperone [bacterium]|nr:MAG: Zn finger domain-containing DnaJ-class molecular chaperone [bacterium]
MRGTLTKACLPDLLRTIYTDRCTGTLILTQGDVRKQVFFELGQIVFASSTRNEDRIGETLVRHGKLTREQLTAVLGFLTPGQHLGNFLVEQGALNPRELISYVNFQIIDIIYSLFSWTVGNYEFAQGNDYLALPTNIPLLRLQSIVLKPIEQRILELVKQPADIIKVLISINELPQKTLKALYGLLSIGLLRQGESPELSTTTGKMVASQALQQQAANALPTEYTVHTTEQIPMPVELISEAIPIQAQTLPPLDLDRVKRDIALIKDRVATQDTRVIFGLSPDPSQEEVQNAYYRLATKFHPDKFIQAPRQVREDIDYIFANLTNLYNKLQIELPGANLAPAITLTSSSASLARPQGLTGGSPSMSRPSGSQQNYSSSPYQMSLQAALDYQIPSSPYQMPSQDSDYQVPSQTPYQAPKYSGYPSSNANSAIPHNHLPPSFTPPTSQGANRGSENFMYQSNPASRTTPKGTVAARVGKIDLEGALNDLFEYLEDRKAPLIVSDSLTSLFKTHPPIYIERTSLVEAIVSWARQKVGFTGRSVNEVFLSVISAIRHAEQARVIQDFDPNQFYGGFIQELARYCPPNEAQNFMNKAIEL